MNKQIAKAVQSLRSATQAICEVPEDLQTREAKSEFQRAKALFGQGWRLHNWGAQLTDTDEEVNLVKDGETVGYWADGVSRDTEAAFTLIGLSEGEESDNVLHFLSDLTAEE